MDHKRIVINNNTYTLHKIKGVADYQSYMNFYFIMSKNNSEESQKEGEAIITKHLYKK